MGLVLITGVLLNGRKKANEIEIFTFTGMQQYINRYRCDWENWTRLILSFLLCWLILNSDLVHAQQSKPSSEDSSLIPDEIVRLRLNFILLRNDEGQGGWDENIEEHMTVLNGAVGWMNGYLSYNGEIRNQDCYGEGSCYPKRSSADYKYIKDSKNKI